MPTQPSFHAAGQGAPISCPTCDACCCRLEVLLLDDRGVPPALTQVDRSGGLVMRRHGDGWCAALDRNTMRCSIYEQRPQSCRDFEMGGPECMEERSCIAPICGT